jgi:hypothetical protein
MIELEDKTGRTELDSRDAPEMPLKGYPRWNRIAIFGLVAAGVAWPIGREASTRIENHDIAIASRRQAPAAGFPATTQTTDHNNAIMRIGLVADLDGKAIAYAAEADRLVVDGRFRVDLPVAQIASLLHARPDLLPGSRSQDEINPDAELIRAQAGTLTDNAKKRSRELRSRQKLAGKKVDAVVAEWGGHEFLLHSQSPETPERRREDRLVAHHPCRDRNYA